MSKQTERVVQSLPTMLVTRTAPDKIRFDITSDIVLWFDDHSARQLAEKLIILTQTPDRPLSAVRHPQGQEEEHE